MKTIAIRIKELNQLLRSEGSQQVYKDISGAHKLKELESIAIGFYSDGIVMKGFPFCSYNSSTGSQILADLLEGYFPYQLKQQYPEGVLLQLVDKVESTWEDSRQQARQQQVQGVQGMLEKQLMPDDKHTFLQRLPKQVVRDGKIYQIRSEIDQMLGPSAKNNNNNNNPKILQEINKESLIESEITVATPMKLLLERNELSQENRENLCSLKIIMECNKEQQPKVLIMHLDKTDSLQEVYRLAKQYQQDSQPVELIQRHPRVRYHPHESATLLQLALYPTNVLVLTHKHT